MGKQTLEIIKEIFLSLLIVVCIGLVLAVILYDKISISKVIPVSEDYVLSAEMKNEINNEKLEKVEEVVINYYIDATDLNKYEKDKEYVKGKSNPFAYESIGESNTTNSIQNTTSNNNNSEGFYEDDGSK